MAALSEKGDAHAHDYHITILVSSMVNAVVFGVGAVAILAIPSLDAQAKYPLPAWIALTVVISPVIARLLAPRVRLREHPGDRPHPGWR